MIAQSLLRLALSVAPLLASPLAARADDVGWSKYIGTTFTRTIPTFADGALAGCLIEFGVLAQDWVYAQGGLSLVNGSFGIMVVEGVPGSILKVIVNDFRIDDGLEPVTSPNAPTRAYLVASDLTTTLSSIVDSYPSDVPGAVFVVSQVSPSLEIVADALVSGKIAVGFNKGDGSTDLQIEVDLTVTDTTDDGQRVRGLQTGDDFTRCLGKLVGE